MTDRQVAQIATARSVRSVWCSSVALSRRASSRRVRFFARLRISLPRCGNRTRRPAPCGEPSAAEDGVAVAALPKCARCSSPEHPWERAGISKETWRRLLQRVAEYLPIANRQLNAAESREALALATDPRRSAAPSSSRMPMCSIEPARVGCTRSSRSTSRASTLGRSHGSYACTSTFTALVGGARVSRSGR